MVLLRRRTNAVPTLLVDLDLREVTLVMQDWGGPIGPRMVTLEQPNRVARLVAMDALVADWLPAVA